MNIQHNQTTHLVNKHWMGDNGSTDPWVNAFITDFHNFSLTLHFITHLCASLRHCQKKGAALARLQRTKMGRIRCAATVACPALLSGKALGGGEGVHFQYSFPLIDTVNKSK